MSPPVQAFRQPSNLLNLLVKSCIRNRLCQRPRCKLCDHIDTSDYVTINGLNLCLQNFSCESSNVNYAIYCDRCPNAVFIGETKSKFRLRFNKHLCSIRGNFTGLPVANHFNNANHSSDNVKFLIINGNYKSDSDRKCKEVENILHFKRHIFDLNKDLGLVSGISFFKS